MMVPGFWERWHYSLADIEPNHVGYNAMQWGSVFAAGATGEERLAAGANLFEEMFCISQARTKPEGVYTGLLHLGCTEATEQAWWASMENILGLLDSHFSKHDFLLGGQPTLGDFGLMGALTHEFEIGGISERRMVAPYHVYMLQRLVDVLEQATASDAGAASVSDWLAQFTDGSELLELKDRLQGCRVKKEGGHGTFNGRSSSLVVGQ